MKPLAILPLLFILGIFLQTAIAAEPKPREVIPAKKGGAAVSPETMRKIYDQVKTPFKYGIVLREEGKKVDCPSVFRHNDKWHMLYIVFDGHGYETHIAESDDLLNWKKQGVVLPASKDTANSKTVNPKLWDGVQKAGFMALQDYAWGGQYGLEKHDGRYWMGYCGGALKGYETDPLSIGMASSEKPTGAHAWDRLPKPVLSAAQSDARHWEKLTLYKSNIIHDKKRSLGWPFVMFYNAKTKSGYERIGMAVSKDMRTWHRYGREPIIDNGKGISGDPQITRIGDVWVMFYFGAFYRPGAFDSFACSHDLVRWTKWDGQDLISPSEPWDKRYAHKPWVIKHDGIVYHFYCAVGDQGRVIAVATSKDLKKGK